LRNLPDGATVQGTGYNQYEWMIPAGTTSDPFPGSVYVEGIATGRQWSIHYTPNLKVYREENGQLVHEPTTTLHPAQTGTQVVSYWVEAIGSGPTGFPSGLDKIHVVLWDSNDQEVGRDTVVLKVQDNSTHFTDWVIPNEWTIDAAQFKTPVPVEGAVGPQREWTGKDYNAYNKGDAYTRVEIEGAFTLTFDVKLDGRFVQPDTNADEFTPNGDQRKLSFVANSGVKIGPLVTDPASDPRKEVAIIDIKRLVDRVGGLGTFNNPSVWQGPNHDKVKLDYGGVSYVAEELTRLLPGVEYNLPFLRYNEMFDLSVADSSTKVRVPGTWQDCYKILQDSYSFFGALGDSYQMKVQWTGSVLTVSVRRHGSVDYTKVYEGTPPGIGAANRLHVQSHWGSGVEFSSIYIDIP